jgi:large subunit ribosomal protein L21
MYAIVEISGKQFRVEKDMKLRVPKQESEPGKKIGFDRVFMIEDDKGNTTIGNPLVKNTQVAATVIEHGRDKKVIVFKKKRRKGYQKKQGHRQDFSVIEINTIGAPTVKKAAPAVKETKPASTKEKAAPAAKKEVKPTEAVQKEDKPTAPAAKKTTAAATKAKSTEKKTTAAKKEKPAAKETTTEAKTAPKKATSTAAKKPAAKKDTEEK